MRVLHFASYTLDILYCIRGALGQIYASTDHPSFRRRHSSYVVYASVTQSDDRQMQTLAAYDQYEAAVPLDLAGSCLAELSKQLYGSDALYEGFRDPILVRFVGKDDGMCWQACGSQNVTMNLGRSMYFPTDPWGARRPDLNLFFYLKPLILMLKW